MNNTVRQTNNQSIIQMGDWYLGIYVQDDGTLAIYVDNSNGVVRSCDKGSDLAEDGYQWAEQFYVEPVRQSKRIWTKIVPRSTVHIEITR